MSIETITFLQEMDLYLARYEAPWQAAVAKKLRTDWCTTLPDYSLDHYTGIRTVPSQEGQKEPDNAMDVDV